MSGISLNDCSRIVAVISVLLLIQFEVSNKAEAHFPQFRKCILHSYLICTCKIIFDDLHFRQLHSIFSLFYSLAAKTYVLLLFFFFISKQWHYIKVDPFVALVLRQVILSLLFLEKDMALILSLWRCIFTHGSRHGTTPSYLSQRESERKRGSQQRRWGGGTREGWSGDKGKKCEEEKRDRKLESRSGAP